MRKIDTNFAGKPKYFLVPQLATLVLALLVSSFWGASAEAQEFTRTCTGDEAAGSRSISNQVTRFDRNDVLRFNNVPDGAEIVFSTVRTRGGRPSGIRYSFQGATTQQFSATPFPTGSLSTGILGVGARRTSRILVGDDGSTGVDNGLVQLFIAAVTNNISNPAAIRQDWSATCTPPDIAIQSLETGSSVNVAAGGSDDHGLEAVGQPKTVQYTITNTLGGTLTIDGPITLSGTNNVTNASITAQPAVTSLRVGDTTTFEVTYTPVAAGTFGFDIMVPNTDFAENAYDIAVTGLGNSTPSVVLTGPVGSASQAGASTPAPTGPFVVTATFSEPVNGFTLAEFIIANGTASNFVMVSPSVYTILVTPTDPAQPISITVPASVAANASMIDNAASNILGFAATSLSSAENAEVRDIIIDEAVRDLRSGLVFNRRAQRAARDRQASSQRCQSLEEDFEQGRIDRVEYEAECDFNQVSRDVPLGFSGQFGASRNKIDLSGSFFGQSTTGERRQLVFGELDVTRFDNDDVTVSLNGRVAWELPLAGDALFGYFLGASLARTNVDRSFSGSRKGLGFSAGVYIVDQLDRNLYWDGFALVGIGRNDLDLGNGSAFVDGTYNTTSFQVGLAISGERKFENLDLRPELSVEYGYTNIGDVALDVARTGTSLSDVVSAGNVELGRISLRPEFVFPIELNSPRYDHADFTFAPSVSCEYIRTTVSDDDCGGGIELEWSATSADGLTEFSARVSHENINGNTRDSVALQFESEF